MNMRSLRLRIILGFMACVGVAVVALCVLLTIGLRFEAAVSTSKAAVEDNRRAAALGRHAATARVALYRYLNTVDATDRAALDAELAAIDAGSSGGSLARQADATSALIQKSQLSAVGLFSSASSITMSLKTLADIVSTSPDERAAALVRHAGEDFAMLTVDLGRLVALHEISANSALSASVEKVMGGLTELQALPGVSPRMKKVAAAVLRDTETLRDALRNHHAVSTGRTEALEALKTGFGQLADDVQRRLDASDAAFVRASDATREASQLMVTSLVVSGISVLVIGVSMALVIGGSITRPVVALTRTMRRVADGELEAAIAGQERRDEIGAMARAVEVFKANGQALRLTEQARAEAAREQSEAVTSIGVGLAGLARGDLTCRLDGAFPPDYRTLQDDFNAAMEQLQATMRTVAEATDSLRTAAGGISGGADELSRRTELQAVTLEQTAQSLEEITATVTRTAEGASQACDAVGASTADAERSEAVVSSAVAAMAAIEQSSSQIADITGLIDHIAAQTSLLSLNAGIEAARAGDAGRGFAVVASEVRGLAVRSAEAAKRIKDLIGTSREQVGAGVELVSQAGQTLQRIASQVAEINTVVGDIAASARTQATALAAVNAAVAKMDQVTRHNAAMVEDTTAASHTLAQQAEELTRLVRRFNVGAAAPIGGSVAAPALRVADLALAA